MVVRMWGRRGALSLAASALLCVAAALCLAVSSSAVGCSILGASWCFARAGALESAETLSQPGVDGEGKAKTTGDSGVPYMSRSARTALKRLVGLLLGGHAASASAEPLSGGGGKVQSRGRAGRETSERKRTVVGGVAEVGDEVSHKSVERLRLEFEHGENVRSRCLACQFSIS